MSIHLFKHNQEAYNSVTAMLEREKMAAVIHPTGTGKSLIAFKLAEEHPSEKFLWLSPSEYIYQTQLENLGMEFDNMDECGYDFVIMVKGMGESIRRMILENKGEFENIRKYKSTRHLERQ